MTNDVTHTTLSIGPELGHVLDVVRAAQLSALLSGRHGIGKSEFLDGYGRSRGLAVHVLDLSLLEATDLTGLPFLREGRTHFAPPAHLPSESEGPSILVLEELNRCDRSVRQPCLQLLTARRLNDYRLPRECFVVACINPIEAGYEVDELDAALASRFVRFDVIASRARWIEWARGAAIDRRVIDFVHAHPRAFESVPPRSWTYASQLLTARNDVTIADAQLTTLLAAVLGVPAALALVGSFEGAPETLDALAVLRKPDEYEPRVRELAAQKRLDVLATLADDLIELLRSPKGKKALKAAGGADVLRLVLEPIPNDLRQRVDQVLAKD